MAAHIRHERYFNVGDDLSWRGNTFHWKRSRREREERAARGPSMTINLSILLRHPADGAPVNLNHKSPSFHRRFDCEATSVTRTPVGVVSCISTSNDYLVEGPASNCKNATKSTAAFLSKRVETMVLITEAHVRTKLRNSRIA